MKTKNVVAIVGALVVMAGASAAKADQCSIVPEDQAEEAARYLGMFSMGAVYSEMCQPCGDEYGVAADVFSVGYAPWDNEWAGEDDFQVSINGETVDLAYTYVLGPDNASFYNLAALVGCETTDVSPCLDGLMNPIEDCEIEPQSADEFFTDYVLANNAAPQDSEAECNELLSNVGEDCLTEDSLDECIAMSEVCSGSVQLLESCPVEFSCDTDGAADVFGDTGEDVEEAGGCSVAGQSPYANVGLLAAVALGMLAIRRRL